LKAAQRKAFRYMSLRLEDDTFHPFRRSRGDGRLQPLAEAGRRSPRSRAAFRERCSRTAAAKGGYRQSAIIACWRRTEARMPRRMSVVPETSAGFRHRTPAGRRCGQGCIAIARA
jgi:hypothetical protein